MPGKILMFATFWLIWLSGCESKMPENPSQDEMPERIIPFEIPASTTTAFVGVNVISMDQEPALVDQTVIVQNGKIAQIGAAADVAIPDSAEQIVAPGHYLMPGLADMHTHVKIGTIDDSESNLLSYIANGVTTILNMGDYNRDILDIRKRVRDGRLIGPNIFAAQFARAPQDGGTPGFAIVSNPDEGRRAVQLAKLSGYDFIKVYNGLSTATFDVITEEARVQNLPVIGHGVRQPGMEYILRNGMVMVAHAEEFIYTLFNNSINTSRIPGATSLVAETGAYVTATLSTYERIAQIFFANQQNQNPVNKFLSEAPARYLDPQRKNAWQNYYENSYQTTAGNIFPQLEFQKQFIKAFHDAGVPLLLGTDSPVIPGLFPGFSIHDEIRLFAEAGLAPDQILRAGTANAAAFIARYVPDAEPFGTVAVGQRADLVLLKENPLENLETLKRRAGVMARGLWLSEANLQKRLDDWRERYGN